MLAELIRNILEENNNYLSLSLLEDKVADKKMKIKINNFLSHASLYTMKDRYLFLKKALTEMKNSFLKDFEEYVVSKSMDLASARNLIEMFAHFIPDLFYPEWAERSLEERLIIYDLLLSLLIGGNQRVNDPIKKYFNELIKLYSLTAVYTSILIRDNDDDFDQLAGYLNAIDPDEEILKNRLFEILIDPFSVLKAIRKKESELKEEMNYIERTIDCSFQVSMNYSQMILKKVISNELSRFESLFLLTRFRFETMYEWIIAMNESEFPTVSDRLLEDLGL